MWNQEEAILLLLEVLLISEAHAWLLNSKEIKKRPGFLTFACHDGVNNVISDGGQPPAVRGKWTARERAWEGENQT
jgi:hypothetical protein